MLPPFKYVADVSIKVAEAVAKKAQEQGWLELKKKIWRKQFEILNGFQSINN